MALKTAQKSMKNHPKMAWKCVFFRHGFWHPFSTPFGMDFNSILDPNLAPKSRDAPVVFRSRLALVFYLTFEPPWSDYGGHLGPSWGHLGLIFEPSCALLDHLGGILAHLRGSPVAKLPGRGILDPEFFPMLQISQKSTKTKKSWPRVPRKKDGRAAVVPRRGVNPPPLPYGKRWRVRSKAQVRNCKSQICRSLTPLKSPHSAPAHSARPPQNHHGADFMIFKKH